MSPRVGILTSFYNFASTYSLCTVVENQLVSLVKYGYKPVLFVLPSFCCEGKVPSGVEIRKVIPQIILEPYHEHTFDKTKDITEKLEADKKLVIEAMEKNMQDIDVAITHDFILVDDYLPYAVGMNEAKLPKVRWLNWIHSAPSGRIPDADKYPWKYQYEVMPNSKIVYLNYTDQIRVAERYNGTVNDVAIVHNPTDPRTFFKLDELVSKMIDQFKLLDADIIQVYPVSTPRMCDNKQVHTVITIFGKLKAQGQNVRLIVCNAHANAVKEKDLVSEMKKLALENGLDISREVIFTSMIEPPRYEHGVSHDVVKDLFLLSNLFVFPTTSENAPLILLEAASCRNLLVLNDDFLPLREFFNENALYFGFGSLRQNRTYENEENYLNDVAKIIIAELSNNRPLNAFKHWKQFYNNDYIFCNYIEPLILKK
jgi:glycosyltransferase involved in cell wall biosynthesis